MSGNQAASTGEKPLSRGSSFALACAAGGTILLFYLFAAGSVLFLLAVLGVELVCTIAAARFGLARPMAKMMNRHMAPLPIFFRSFWLRKGSELRVTLQADRAPGLFNLLTGLCQRARVTPPQEVCLEMSVNAWVRMQGYRRGVGRTTLGIGYDLLAGLTQAEIEAVLAHEVTHARLVQRGLNKWLRGGLNRAARLAGGLAALVDAGRRTKQPSELAQLLHKPAHWLARTCARLVSACSRQDEFSADLGAAELCGADALRSALMKLEGIGKAAARLPWRERVAQMQLGMGFSQWLVAELTSVGPLPSEARAEPFNQYATHPSLSDRLAALPVGGKGPAGISPSGLELLGEPDRIAEELIAEIQRVVAQEEQKDTKALDRWSKKIRSDSQLHPIQTLGLLIAILGLAFGVAFWATVGFSGGLLAFMAGTIIPGILCCKFFGYRERLALPVPEFATLKTAFQTKIPVDESRTKEIESGLRNQMAAERKKARKERVLAEATYAALGQCDYLKAHVAARLCLQVNNRSLEGMVGLGVAAAAFGQVDQVTKAIQALRRRTKITRGSPAWGTAWALLLSGNWSQAEAFLQLARKARPEQPALLALQALCQARRGKLQSAIVSARQAFGLKPQDPEYTKFLVNLLLDGGFLKEAQAQLDTLTSDSTTDTELMFAMVRLHLMSRRTDAAQKWTDRIRTTSPGARTELQLGGVYESCRQDAQAVEFYTQALSSGHYPEAHLALGRIAATKQHQEVARGHFLQALNLSQSAADAVADPFRSSSRFYSKC